MINRKHKKHSTNNQVIEIDLDHDTTSEDEEVQVLQERLVAAKQKAEPERQYIDRCKMCRVMTSSNYGVICREQSHNILNQRPVDVITINDDSNDETLLDSTDDEERTRPLSWY